MGRSVEDSDQGTARVNEGHYVSQAPQHRLKIFRGGSHFGDAFFFFLPDSLKICSVVSRSTDANVPRLLEPWESLETAKAGHYESTCQGV